MILTITLNPAVDINYKLDNFSIDTVNRVNDISKTAGGKGLNVARVLKQLGEQVATSGFLGGSLGNFIRKEVQNLDMEDYFVEIDGETRNCIAVIHEGQQTEILEAGPRISKADSEKLLDKFQSFVQRVDYVAISGSMPKGLPDDYYAQLIKIAHEHNVSVLLDTNGEQLNRTLSESTPYLIKPNEEEFAEFFGEDLNDEEAIVEALLSEKLGEIPWVVVTLGSKGAFIKKDEYVFQATIPKVDVINPVGSGDSVIAGLAAGFRQKLATKDIIKYGLTMGVLNAMEEKTGHINPQNISVIMEQIRVEAI